MTEYAPTNIEKKLKLSKEKIAEKSKETSEKIGRFVFGTIFDRNLNAFMISSGITIDKETQKIMREQDYQQGREKRAYQKDKSIYYARRIGAYAMMVPGVGIGVDHTKAIGKDFVWERRRAAAKKREYRQEHGTFISKTTKHYNNARTKLDELNIVKEELDNRKPDKN